MNTSKRAPKNSPDEMRDNIVGMLDSIEQMLPFLDGIDTSPITRQLAGLAAKLNVDVQPVQASQKPAGEQRERSDRIIGLDGKTYPRQTSPELPERVLGLRGDGWTIREIARELGCSVGTVHRHIKTDAPPPIQPADEPKRAYKGSANAKKQLRALEACTGQVGGVADALEAVFTGGFEKTCTPELAGAAAVKLKRDLNRIEQWIKVLESR